MNGTRIRISPSKDYSFHLKQVEMWRIINEMEGGCYLCLKHRNNDLRVRHSKRDVNYNHKVRCRNETTYVCSAVTTLLAFVAVVVSCIEVLMERRN
jgi:hypothetical protein